MLKSFLSFQSVQNELTDASASSSKATMDQYLFAKTETAVNHLWHNFDALFEIQN